MSAAIELDKVRFSWSSQVPIIDIDHWRVDCGDTLLLRGASGSGKSTLLSLLAGINKPQRGEICLLGSDITRLSARQRDKFRADHIGYIFQQFNLLPYLSAHENVLLGVHFSALRRQRLTQSATQTATDYLSRLGLSKQQQQQPAAVLSVGQQQRVAAARALIGAPEILIADEPTSALDTEHRDVFIKLLLELSQANNTTVVFVTHDATLAGHFNTHTELSQLNPLPQTASAGGSNV
ncbi:putative ABC transport system ATP-binding protein [Idiomarina aquatica]|uniref:Putative ABC transport system ATP-binding protein n=1 Tax=Idiomarina aquatica TaxID=1327752 RepID=A0A4R6P4X6_9GAMM|nr:ABC transporter ATP-binding protein [Idiomarina aquatica]TDP32581.1 putative ABC transport system ATP-binding protein [Idiomarina aquatica]